MTLNLYGPEDSAAALEELARRLRDVATLFEYEQVLDDSVPIKESVVFELDCLNADIAGYTVVEYTFDDGYSRYQVSSRTEPGPETARISQLFEAVLAWDTARRLVAAHAS